MSLLLGQAGNRLLMLGRLEKAVAPMKEALAADIARKAWKYASVDADNLAITHMILGKLSHAADYSKLAVRLADQSRDDKQRVSARSTRGDILHHMGRRSDAKSTFERSEEIKREIKRGEGKRERGKGKMSRRQRRRDRGGHVPSSLLGHRYHDLLLGQGKYREVLEAVHRILEDHRREGFNLIDVALLHLSLGRAHLLQAAREGAERLGDAEAYLNRAMSELRQTGREIHLPRGLLARADVYRAEGEFERAEDDLAEAARIAQRGSMGLHEADCHLGYARLHLARGEKEKARARWAKAREMIKRMEYHRRDRDVREIDEELKAAGG